MSFEEKLLCENTVLRQFIRALGFDAAKVIEQLSDDTNATSKNLSLAGLRVVRDFTNTSFSPAGITAANKWLDSLVETAGDTERNYQVPQLRHSFD